MGAQDRVYLVDAGDIDLKKGSIYIKRFAWSGDDYLFEVSSNTYVKDLELYTPHEANFDKTRRELSQLGTETGLGGVAQRAAKGDHRPRRGARRAKPAGGAHRRACAGGQGGGRRDPPRGRGEAGSGGDEGGQ